MKVEKMFNMYGIGLDHSEDKRLPMKYQKISHLFDTFKAGTKAAILEEMEIDFELDDELYEIFFFNIDGSKYKVYSDDLDYRFFNGTYKVIASKVE